MIHIQRADDEITAVNWRRELDIHDVTEDCIWAEACMDQLEHEPAASLEQTVWRFIARTALAQSFRSLHLSRKSQGLSVASRPHTEQVLGGPGGYNVPRYDHRTTGVWYRVYGRGQRAEDDWKGLTYVTLEHVRMSSDLSQEAAAKLHDLIYTAETALSV
jgi:hypothetical protein